MIDTWAGFYTLEVGYPFEQRSKPFKFWLEWTVENGIIKGTCIDEESRKVFSEPAKIHGFIEADFVSFIKKYPYSWGYDENNDLILVDNISPPEIHYTGNFIEKHFEGIWEMTLDSSAANGQVYEKYYSGTWLMKRTKN
jgi:hypothetical protein